MTLRISIKEKTRRSMKNKCYASIEFRSIRNSSSRKTNSIASLKAFFKRCELWTKDKEIHGRTFPTNWRILSYSLRRFHWVNDGQFGIRLLHEDVSHWRTFVLFCLWIQRISRDEKESNLHQSAKFSFDCHGNWSRWVNRRTVRLIEIDVINDFSVQLTIQSFFLFCLSLNV